MIKKTTTLSTTSLFILLCLSAGRLVKGEDPYHFFDWHITYGTISPLGIPVEAILINGQFPGPTINCTSNNNIWINVFNEIDEPFLLHWSGVQLRKSSWQDGTPGTMCPIMPGMNFTYRLQVKDQIGTFAYFPTLNLHKAAGGTGVIKVHSRELIPVPFDNPADEYVIVMGDWYNKGHKTMKKLLDSGHSIGRPDGIHINGKSFQITDKPGEPLFLMEANKVFRYRVCNVGMRTSLNFRFQGHFMTLVEMEGSHTVQNEYDSMDIHVGQCVSVLVKANKEPMDYYFVVSSRFIKEELTSVAIIRYKDGRGPALPELPPPPPVNTEGIAWSINQFRTFRWNLTASAARPNPQGSYHYGKINITRTIKLVNSRHQTVGKLRFAINGVSHINTDTPVKLAEYFGVADKVFQYNLMSDDPPTDESKIIEAPNVLNATFRNFVEIIFENRENTIQTWHLDGHAFFAVAIEPGRWTPEKRKNYNLIDTVSRHNIQVYPQSWAAVMTTLDNAGMWNLRSDMWERYYLGQQMYISVLSPERSLRDEYNIPDNAIICGAAVGQPMPPTYNPT